MGYAALEFIEEINTNISNEDGFKLLDFGCGEGRWARPIKNIYPKLSVHGYDIDKSKIDLAKSSNADINFFQEYETFLRTGKYDYIIAPFVYHDNDENMIKEIHKVLKPQGKLFIIDYDMLELTPNEFKKEFFEPTELEEIAKVGFHLAYIKHTAKNLTSFRDDSSKYFTENFSKIINNKYFIWTGTKK